VQKTDQDAKGNCDGKQDLHGNLPFEQEKNDKQHRIMIITNEATTSPEHTLQTKLSMSMQIGAGKSQEVTAGSKDLTAPPEVGTRGRARAYYIGSSGNQQ